LGFLIKGWTPTDYRKAIESFFQLTSFEKEASRQLACENFSLDKGISTFEAIYKKVW
jgi:hypothetical protein